MADSRLAPLKAIHRLRQMSVEDAQKTLADALRSRDACRRLLEDLTSQVGELQGRQRMTVLAGDTLDIERFAVARRYSRWLVGELESARKLLERAARAEGDARAKLADHLRARDAVSRLIDRRQSEHDALLDAHNQHVADDQGALRVARAMHTNADLSGAPNGY